ncbi:MAG: NAD-dependent epimerase/dehydratase family protein [Pseudomonadota bacterium]
MSRLVALTGGTGFLGRHAIRAFHERGWRVRALVRRAPDMAELADAPIELTLGRLDEPDALDRLCAGADAILHLAGLVKAASRAAFMAANADGAGAVAASWRRAAPDARFVLVSSMAARAPELSDYAASKREGEARVAALAEGGDWRALRPAAVYGSHDEESLKVLKLADGPVQIMLNAAEARVAMIDARDAAAALAAFVERPGRGEVHELTDARRDGYAWRELAETAARALGRRPRPLRLPPAILKAVGAVGERLAARSGSAEMLTHGKAREILHADWSGDPALAPPDDVWRPAIPLERGLAEMAVWARAAGRL